MRNFTFFLLLFSTLVHANAHLVTNVNNAGAGSLRNMISLAQPGDTVKINPALLSLGNIDLNLTSEIYLDKAITIIGAIQFNDTLFIVGTNNNRAFNMENTLSNSKIYLKDLAFKNFSGPLAGTVIRSSDSHILYLENCHFNNNSSTGNSSIASVIFAEYNELFLKDCTFRNNYSSCTGPGGVNGPGGAAINAYGVDVTAEDCQFINNQSCASGGAVDITAGFGRFTRCTFLNNSLSDSTGLGGGAVSLMGSYNSYFIDCHFEGNQSASSGGALFLSSSGSMDITNSTFSSNNSLLTSGGALIAAGVSLYITNCSFDNNQLNNSNMMGGALSVSHSFLQLQSSTLYNNTSPVIFLSSSLNRNAEIINSSIINTTSSAKEIIYAHQNYDIKIRNTIVVGGGSGPSITGGTTITNEGYNILNDNPAFTVSTDLTNVSYANLKMNPYGLYGGDTKTLTPGKNSPALNMGFPQDHSPAQNSVIFGRRDIGAGEYRNIIYETVSACQSYNWNGKVLHHSGKYIDTAFNANTLDSINILNLKLTKIDTTVIQQDSILTALEQNSGTNYQWVDCDNAFTALPGENDSVFIIQRYGNFAVIISKDGCSDTSACLSYQSFSTEEFNSSKWLSFYPNPSSGIIHFESTGNYPSIIEVWDLSGKILFSRKLHSIKKITLPDLPQGTYILKCKDPNGNEQIDRILINH